MNSAVQFGAGNIGRGFLGQLFCESGFETVFVDVADRTVEALNARGEYTIRIVGPGSRDVRIHSVRAIHGTDTDAVADAVARSGIVSTAVGAGALEHLAPNLARGLALRFEQGGGPLNVLICENLHGANDHLRALVAASLPEDARERILASTGFVQAVVSRMVPIQELDPQDPLAIRVEAYKRLPVDGEAIVGALPNLVGVEPVVNFEAHVERKLYAHNGSHAALGYLGWLKGHEFGWQALEDQAIRSKMDALLEETSEALVRKHGFDRAEHAEHVRDLVERFANRELRDTCFRLGRDPVRKLAPGDRLSGAAALCLEQGIQPRALPTVIAAAFRFRPPEDPSATRVHMSIVQGGFEAALEQFTGIRASSTLGMAIHEEYERLAGR